MKAYHEVGTTNMILLNESEIITKNVCESYDDYSQLIGCYDAGCYSINNSDSDFHIDLINHLCETFEYLSNLPIEKITELQFTSVDEFIVEFIDMCDSEGNHLSHTQINEITETVNSFVENNTVHSEHECVEYNDGANWKTLVISNDSNNVNLEIVEDVENDRVLSEFNLIEWSNWKSGLRYKYSENYIFTESNYSDDYGILVEPNNN